MWRAATFALLVLTSLTTGRGYSQVSAPQVIKQIIQATRYNTEGLKSARARVWVRQEATRTPSGRYLPRQETETIAAFKGRMGRYEQRRTVAGKLDDKWGYELYVYDGERGVAYQPNAREGWRHKKNNSISYNDPRQWGFYYYTPEDTIADVLEKARREGRLKLVGAKRDTGHPQYVLRMNDAGYKTSYDLLYIDPSIGYLIRKRESYVMIDGIPKLVGRDEIFKATQYSPGRWFPVQFSRQAFTETGKVWARVDARIEDFQPNVAIPNREFRLDFPVGTTVTDNDTGRVFVVTAPWQAFRRTIAALLLLAAIIAFGWWRRRIRPLPRAAG